MNSTMDLIEDIRKGNMVLLVDDEDRENEGDLVLAADFCTPEKINFMIQKARGLVCLAMTEEQIARLGLPLMVHEDRNLTPNKTAFTVSIEAADGVSTGISAQDRSHTIRVASSPEAKPENVISPGHIFPIKAQPGGVLRRAGHTEGSVDLARLAGLNPAAVICEVMNDDGTMARVPDLIRFARSNGIKIGSIVDLIEHRLRNETLVRETAHRELEFEGQRITARVFESLVDGSEHLALVKGLIRPEDGTLVRVHRENILSDMFHFAEFSGPDWRSALRSVLAAPQGVFLHLRPARQILHLSPRFTERVQLDELDYGVGAQVLKALGVGRLRLLSNHPAPRPALKAYGLEVIEHQSF